MQSSHHTHRHPDLHRSIRRPRRNGTLATFVALLCVHAFPAQGSALSFEAAVSSVADGTQGEVRVECLGNERVLGGGVAMATGSDTGWVNATHPADGSDPDGKSDDAWLGYVDATSPVSATTTATCIGGRVAKNLEYPRVETKIKAETVLTVKAECPAGFRATGGGVANSAGWGTMELKATHPSPDGRLWVGTIRNFGHEAGTMTVHAICAKGRWGRRLEYRVAKATATSQSQGVAFAGCPGGTLISGGIDVRAVLSNVHGTARFDESLWAGSVDSIGGGDVKFRAHSVCAT